MRDNERDMKQLDTVQVKTLRELHDKVRIVNAELAVAKAKLDLYLTRIYIEAGVNNQTMSVCIWCGRFVPIETGCNCNAKQLDG